jgi:hypothetical protein
MPIHRIYPIVVKYSKWPECITTFSKVLQNTYTRMGIFGLKINHLATLLPHRFKMSSIYRVSISWHATEVQWPRHPSQEPKFVGSDPTRRHTYLWHIFRGQRLLVPLLILGPPSFSDYSLLVHHPVNRDDRHLLAHAMASDFTVTWQYSQREHMWHIEKTKRGQHMRPRNATNGWMVFTTAGAIPHCPAWRWLIEESQKKTIKDKKTLKSL